MVLTPEGEVWTCGLVLGDPRSVWSRLLESFVTIVCKVCTVPARRLREKAVGGLALSSRARRPGVALVRADLRD